MISTLNTTLNKVNDSLDLPIHLPSPNNEHLANASTVNFLLGTTAICYGLITKKKRYCVMGGLSLLSAWVLKEEILSEK